MTVDGAQDRLRTPGRRRGAALEDAILRAAWDEYQEAGYAGLTMEGVAARAGTGKAVLYRRWPNRAVLMIAALRRQVVPLAEAGTDTGTLRGDLLAMLHLAAGRYTELGHDVVFGLLREIPYVQSEIFAFSTETVGAVVARAAARGEVDPGRVTPRLLRLPLDLVRHEIVATHATVPDDTLAELVDQIIVPLYTGRPWRPAGSPG